MIMWISRANYTTMKQSVDRLRLTIAAQNRALDTLSKRVTEALGQAARPYDHGISATVEHILYAKLWQYPMETREEIMVKLVDKVDELLEDYHD